MRGRLCTVSLVLLIATRYDLFFFFSCFFYILRDCECVFVFVFAFVKRVYGHCILWNGGFLLGRAIACVNVGHLLRLLLFCFCSVFVVGQRYLKFTWSIAVGRAKGLLGFESKNEKRPSASSAWLSWPSGTANKNCYEDDDDDPDGRTPNDGGCCGCSEVDAPPPMMTAVPSPHCSSSASLVSDQITASTRSCWGCS